MKLKEFGPLGGHVSLTPPLDLPLFIHNLLMPANEVWSKVMIFSRVGFPVCTTGHLTGGSAMGGLHLGGLYGGGGWADSPRYMGHYGTVNNRAVRILLECILVTVHNKVAKVMFSQASVCPQGGAVPAQGGGLPQVVSAPRVVGVPGSGGGLVSQHALRQTPLTGDTATAADGTHPTGMHSC